MCELLKADFDDIDMSNPEPSRAETACYRSNRGTAPDRTKLHNFTIHVADFFCA